MANTWNSLIQTHQPYLHLNPSLPSGLREELHSLTTTHARKMKQNLVWILSSGTNSSHQNNYKLIGLTHQAFLASATSVNQHLQVTHQDSWLNVLPLFHVGGLSILYRSSLAAIPCFNLWETHYKWNPLSFTKTIEDTKATLTSLVPTQVYDLISQNLPSPTSLRAVFVGGSHLSETLYQQGLALGWPLLPSFGMTEAASQIATVPLESLNVQKISSPTTFSPDKATPTLSPPLKLLNHIQARVDSSAQLAIQGPSICEGYYFISEGNPSTWHSATDADAWFKTQDCAKIEGEYLTLLARVDELIKIRGELVNLAHLRNKLQKLCHQLNVNFECTLSAAPDPRLGYKLILVGNTTPKNLASLFAQFNAQVLPFEKLSDYWGPVSLPKNDLGKILHPLIVEQWIKREKDK